MKQYDFIEQYSHFLEKAECTISNYEKFKEKYNFSDRQYFVDKLIKMGYNESEVFSILVNKDLLLALFMNSFENIIVDNENKIDIDIEVEKARKAYIDAVDCANQSIEGANEAYNLMISLKSLIESEYGSNDNDWDEKSVHEMNKAILVYNRLVEKANKDVESSNVARKELAKIRSRSSNVVLINDNDIVLETG